MKGFIGWIRQQAEYQDLVGDMGGNVGTLANLIRDMEKHWACPEAWSMLIDAICCFPGERPPHLDKKLFSYRVPIDLQMQLLTEWGRNGDPSTVLTDDQLKQLTSDLSAVWHYDEDAASEVLDEIELSTYERCVIMAEVFKP